VSDFTATYRWAQESEVKWADLAKAEENDRMLEQWLGAPADLWTPTFVLSDGSTPSYMAGGIGRWARQRGQFVTASFTYSATSTSASTGKEMGISLPTAPAPVPLPVGGDWWFPAGGAVVTILGTIVGSPAGGTYPFPIQVGGTYYAGLGGDGATAGVVGFGLIVYREAV
jgi:hypothetical protein